jgi:hypothetical protein
MALVKHVTYFRKHIIIYDLYTVLNYTKSATYVSPVVRVIKGSG